MATFLSYEYRDGNGYWQTGSIRLTQKLSFDQAQIIVRTLDDGYYFIPKQVGLPACPYSQQHSDSDHPWHNFNRLADAVNRAFEEDDYDDSDLYTSRPQDVESELMRPEDLKWAFQDAEAKGWDEFS